MATQQAVNMYHIHEIKSALSYFHSLLLDLLVLEYDIKEVTEQSEHCECPSYQGAH